MKLPIPLVSIIGKSPLAKALKQVVDLDCALFDESVRVDELKNIDDLTEFIGNSRNLVIVTDVDSPTNAVEISHSIFCNKVAGSLVVITNGSLLEDKISSTSFIGLEGEYTFGDSTREGHGLLNVYRKDFLAQFFQLIDNLESISPEEFETLLNQASIGQLRNFYKKYVKQKNAVKDESWKELISILIELSQLSRMQWNLCVLHHQIDFAITETKELIELCRETKDNDKIFEKIRNTLAQTYVGIPND